VSAVVNNFANGALSQDSGDGLLSLAGSDAYVLDFGEIAFGAADPTAQLRLTNLIGGPADDLAGTWTVAASDFGLGGFDAFSDLSAGSFLDDLIVSLETSTLGDFSGSAVLSPRSENASGFSGALASITLTIEGTIFLPGDFDDDGDVDGADFLSWQRGGSPNGINSSDLTDWEANFGTQLALPGDFDSDGDVDGADFLSWQRGDGTAANLALWEGNFGAGGAALLASSATSVPEPSTTALAALALAAFGIRRKSFKRPHGPCANG